MKKQHFAILISACMLLSAPAAIMAEEVTEEVAEEAVETVSEEAAEEETTPAGLEVWLSDEPITGTFNDFEISDQDIVLLFNNDVHGGISGDKDYSGSGDSLGYAGMAAVKNDALKAAKAVTTIDLGDAIQWGFNPEYITGLRKYRMRMECRCFDIKYYRSENKLYGIEKVPFIDEFPEADRHAVFF